MKKPLGIALFCACTFLSLPQSMLAAQKPPRATPSADGSMQHKLGSIPPGSAAVTCLVPERRHLYIAEQLSTGRADTDQAAAVIRVFDLQQERVIKELPLPNGGNIVNCLALSPDGRFIAATHLIAHFNRATTHLRGGWLNANALTILDAREMCLVGTVLLDEPTKGAANPWGLGWTADGAILVVSHAGTHEVSIIDFPALTTVLLKSRVSRASNREVSPKRPEAKPILFYTMQYEGLEPELPFLVGARKRLRLPEGDLGPREVTVIGRTAYVTNFFSRTVTAIDLGPGEIAVSLPEVDRIISFQQQGKASATNDAGPQEPPRTRESVLAAMTLEQRGEFYFHDASICLQGWQSCASCHPNEGRADALNWDLLNDGIGNPKNTKSLLLAFDTPPAMSTGVRESAHEAVIAGLRHILFTEPKPEIVTPIEAYIRSLKPVPSPRLVNGGHSPSALRGRKIFRGAGCADCHPPPLFTDKQSYDVGTRGPHDKAADAFDTPTLVEIWRTAPYLHDGSAATIREVLTRRNPEDRHGQTSQLSAEELDDLSEYLLSL